MQRSGIPPENWVNFTEIKFRITNVPLNFEATDLRVIFTSYGNIHKIEIETTDANQSIGIAYITFKPVPSSPFWMRPVLFNKRNLCVEYQSGCSNLFHDQADGKSKLKLHSFRAESLELGVNLNPDTFVSEARYTDSVNFVIDYQKRKIQIQFGVNISKQIHSFKLEIEFKNIDGEIHVEEDDLNLRGSITIANKYPPKYWMLDRRLQSRDKFNWYLDDSWKRKTEIRVLPKSKEEKEVPLQPHMPDNSEQLGKWVVFRITFDLDQVKTSLTNFIRKAGILSKRNKPLNTVNGTNLRKYVKRSMLNFEILYMVECNLSFNYLHDYNLNDDFFNLLSKLPTQLAINILEKIYSTKKRIYNPISYLRSESTTMKHNIEFNKRHVPNHCVMVRKVVVTPTTMYILVPTIEISNRVIRHFRDKKDNFLRVQFVDEASNKVGSSYGSTSNYALYNRIFNTLYNGINIGDRRYEFLAFSSSQLRDHSCWFFASTPDLTADDIRKWMGDFSDIKTVAKYAARMGQCFSSTRAIQNLAVNDIKEIPDVVLNNYVFSDGIGKLSFNLAIKIAKQLELKNIPSAFQFRLAGYKGMLCQSNSVRGDQIQVRPSQYKFNSNHNVLEIIRYSTFIPAYLNRQAITLLTTLGVPDKIFIGMKDSQVNELNKMFDNESTAIRVLQKNIDENGISQYLVDLIKAGFLQRNDCYLVNMISLFRIMMLRDLKKKAKIRVEKGAFLLGVLDETKSLKEDQIYCCISDPSSPRRRKVITGNCVVFRNPCFHPGDMRVVTAVNCKALDNLLDVIVFPGVGYRDIPSQCSGGDLDGDDFTIIYDESLIPKRRNLEPMNYESQISEVVDCVTMNDIKNFFVNYILSDQLGVIANAHLAKADYFDSGALHGQCIRLAQLHSEAVDFPKTGRPAIFPPGFRVNSYPDFMEKSDKSTYASEKVLGTLYRSIKEEEFKPNIYPSGGSIDIRLRVEGFLSYLEEARSLKRSYDSDIKGLMNQFGIKTEFEVISGYIVNTVTKVGRKKARDLSKSVMDASIPIRKHYRRIFEEEFYGEGTNTISPEARNRMESKASAWYYVTYSSTELKNNDGGEHMISFPWIIHDILCKIATRNNDKVNGNNNRSSMNYQQTSDKNNNDISEDINRLRGIVN